jgi:xanthine dehydrogenase YagT iron-sulfur-binding subunit
MPQAELSRREVLTGSICATIGAGAVMNSEQSRADISDGNGVMAQEIALNVNAVERRLKVAPQTTLAEALRGPLGLTGTKIACNRGACSACTVWLDGVPICSCMMLAIEVGERKVRTIEGLADGDRLHPVQQAFIEHDAMQCGFCTPGMAMSAAALIERNPDPSAAEVEKAISGHICRCGTYPHVVAATLAAARSRRG